MKSLGKKLSFAVVPVVSGQKVSQQSDAYECTANSTAGGFSITPKVSSLLGVGTGDYVQFLTNRANVEAAVSQMLPEIVEAATENGFDLATQEGRDGFIAAASTYYIAKGYALKSKTGEILQVNERLSKEDKLKFIAENASSILEENREVLAKRAAEAGNPEATDEELIALIKVEDVVLPTDKYNGSRCRATGMSVGTGVKLHFTDTNIWNQIKADLSEDEKGKVNRVMKVCVDEVQEDTFNDGYENIVVKFYPLEFDRDAEVQDRKKKKA